MNNKKKAKKPAKITAKPIKRFVEFYYMLPEKTDVKALSSSIYSLDPECVEIWKELNLMEVVLDQDSLIFQDAWESFEDPLDLEFFEEKGIQAVYQVSFESRDMEKAKMVLKEILTDHGGFLGSDTDDFEPIYKL